MLDGTIGLDKGHGLLGWAIKKVSGRDFGHAKQYIYGFTWERTMWWSGLWYRSGIRVRLGEIRSDYYGQPKTPLTESQVKGMLTYWLNELDRRRRYNWFKLLAMASLVAFRSWFEKVGWMPYANSRLGDVCSPTVDEACKAGGWDVLPGRNEEFTAPGDFLDSPEVEWTKE
jgi:hypothetical protein